MQAFQQPSKQLHQETNLLSENQFVFDIQNYYKSKQTTSIFTKYIFGKVDRNAPFKLYETTCSSTTDENESSQEQKQNDISQMIDQSDQKQNQNNRKARGPYKKYTVNEKMLAVQRINQGQDVKKISKQYGIPRRNLLRWRKNGCQRKQGGGRPTDQQMERTIYDKIMNKQLNNQKEVRNYALKLTNISTFKASKGWFVKFCNRYGLEFNSIQISSNQNNKGCCQQIQIQ